MNDDKVIILYVCSICNRISGCNRNNCGDCLYRNPCAFRRDRQILRKTGELCWECESNELVMATCKSQKKKRTPRPDLSIKCKRKKKRRRK